jgi:hypothetical protein
MARTIDDHIEEAQKALLASQTPRAKKAIVNLYKKNKIPRFYLAKVAELARRSGLPRLTINLLHDVIYPPSGLVSDANESEILTYASGLIRLGAVSEGKKLLQTLKNSQHPQVSLYLSFASVYDWNYLAAAQQLETYLQFPGLSPHQRIVGLLNLATAYLAFDNVQKSEPIIEEIEKISRQNKFERILGILHIIKAEQGLNLGEIHFAREELQKAKKYFLEKNSQEAITIQRWELVANLKEFGSKKIYLQELDDLETKAELINSFEVKRAVDYLKAFYFADHEKLAKNFFASSSIYYRKKLQIDFKNKMAIPEKYQLKGIRPSDYYLDLNNGQANQPEYSLKTGQIMHRALHGLTLDLYRPMTIPQLHEHLFPEEFFNPSSSISKIHSVFKRIREWSETHHFNLSIQAKNGFYKLINNGSLTFLFSESLKSENKNMNFFKQFQKQWNQADIFSTKIFAEKLHLSHRSSSRILKSLVEENLIAVEGHGRTTRYRLLTDKFKLAA